MKSKYSIIDLSFGKAEVKHQSEYSHEQDEYSDEYDEGEGESEDGWGVSIARMNEMIHEAIGEAEKGFRFMLESRLKEEINYLKLSNEAKIASVSKSTISELAYQNSHFTDRINELDSRIMSTISRNLDDQHLYEQRLMDYMNEQKIKRKQDKSDINMGMDKLRNTGSP